MKLLFKNVHFLHVSIADDDLLPPRVGRGNKVLLQSRGMIRDFSDSAGKLPCLRQAGKAL